MKSRIERDQATVRLMIDIYCKHKLGRKEMPDEYRELADYACKRLEHCSWGEAKPACKDCPHHCYAPDKREKVRKVMRWVGPRMLFYSPRATFRHLSQCLFRKKRSTVAGFLLTMLLLLMQVVPLQAQLSRKDYMEITRGKDANVGVAVIYKGKVTCFRNRIKYPVMSVVKLPVAVCALNKMEKEGIKADKEVTLTQSDLLPDTYSPLRDQSHGASVTLSIEKLLYYMLALSDNNACDWFMAYCGGPSAVDRYVRQQGIKGFNIQRTEADMHANLASCYDNWAHPKAVARLLEKLWNGSLLNKENTSLVESIMERTETGADKLKGGLPDNIRLAHKTGHSDRVKGILIGDADAGVLTTQQGERCILVVLIKDSALSDKDTSKIFRDIARKVSSKLDK